MSSQALLLWFHLLAAAGWVGGMAAIHFAVRPAAGETLQPPARLAFMAAMLRRFFLGVAAAIGVLLATGFAMVAQAGGLSRMPWGVQAMMGAGLAMMVIFAVVRAWPYPRLLRAVAAGDGKAAADALAVIRRLVTLNLALGALVFGFAVVSRSA